MKEKSISIPFGMIFKKYYCSHCGTKLIKEKTYRIITKDDKDYYQYHEFCTFPNNDHHAYSYQFKCPNCNKRIAYIEQRIISKIQRKNKKYILTFDEIKCDYNEFKNRDSKIALVYKLTFIIFIYILFFCLYCMFNIENIKENIYILILLFFIISSVSMIMTIRSHYGKNKLKMNKDYSFDEKSKYEKLHSYCSHNKVLIEKSTICYCIHCKKEISPSKISKYIDNNQTALCPYCGIDSVIPNNINEELNNEIIEMMNKYWF